MCLCREQQNSSSSILDMLAELLSWVCGDVKPWRLPRMGVTGTVPSVGFPLQHVHVSKEAVK